MAYSLRAWIEGEQGAVSATAASETEIRRLARRLREAGFTVEISGPNGRPIADGEERQP